MGVSRRLAQGVDALFRRLPRDRDAILAEALSPPQDAAFATLPAFDQRHLCAVYRFLKARGVSSPELLQAALLHDLGKVANGGRVRLLDRAAKVVLETVAPGALHRLSALPAPRWRRGLALAVHHPVLGAAWAAELGCNERVCWLIAHHADEAPPDDPELALLIRADRST